MRVRWAVFALAVPFAAFSCATGIAPADLGADDESADSGDNAPPPAKDGGGTKTDAGGSYNTGNDAGRIDAGAKDGSAKDGAPAQDSAVTDTGAPDTAPPPPPPPTGDDCQGATGQQIGISYDDECDNYYQSSFGFGENDCRPGKTDCKALDGTQGYTFCCYKAPSGSACDFDYVGTPQCVPK